MKRIAFFISLFAATALTYSAGKAQSSDGPGIEQRALEYFLQKLDSLVLNESTGQRFDKDKGEIYYSGKTSMFDDLVLGDFKTYVFTRRRFIDPGSVAERNTLLVCAKEPVPLHASRPFLFIAADKSKVSFNKPQVIWLGISNAYLYKDHYFVRFRLDRSAAIHRSYVYFKMDKTGALIDWVATSDFL